MKKKYSNLLLTVSLSTTLILGCMSMGSRVLAATDEMGGGNIDIEAASDEPETQIAADGDEANVDVYAEEVYTEGIAIDEVTFPDVAFKKYVQDHIDQDKNGFLDESEIKACTEIDCSGLGISNLTGIEIFYNLEKLDCCNNNLSNLDISQNTALTQLYCYGNQLSSVDTSKNTKLKKIVLLDTPVISKLDASKEGIQITWNKVTGAKNYCIYYKADSGSWKKLVTTASDNYTWTEAKIGTNYSFSVRCVDDSGNITSDPDDIGKSIQYVATPKLSSVTNVYGGVEINWGKVAGAEKYRVYYKLESGKWTKIADTTSTSYTWVGAKSGTTYKFTVRCLSSNGNFTSAYDSTGKSIQYVAAPDISSVANVNGGVKITWEKPEGAEKYRVYYKTGSGGWKKITSTTSNSYTWKGAKSGTTYAFTVRCVNSEEKKFTSSFDNVGKSIQYLATPEITSVKNSKTGIKLTWNTVAGAEKYRVFYKTGSGSWKRIASTTSNSYTWTGAEDGITYAFTVRCISNDEKNYTSGYDNKGKTLVRLAQPAISRISAENSGVKITWGKVTGATKYRVYYKSSSGWKLLKETADTSCKVNMATGNTYVYTVKALNGSSASSYHSGKSFRQLAVPKISSVSKTDAGVKISWNKVTGAEKYRVYYKTNNGGWIKIADTTTTSYTWAEKIKEKTAYKFTVRCISGDAKTFTSGYDAQGKMLPNSEEQYYAAQVLDKVGWDLWEAFKWSASMPYERFYDDPVPKGYTKCQWYSLYGFKNYRGNCHVMASTFYHMAILLGYDAHYVFGYVPLQRGGVGEHGWVEIDLNGKTYVCDPDFTLYTTLEKGYMFTYGTSGTWRYQDYHREN